MDIGSISSGVIATNMKQKATDAVSMTNTNKTIDTQMDSAAKSMTSVEKTNATETHLGGQVNTYA